MLNYVAKIRLPNDVTKEEINYQVKSVIDIMGLQPHKKKLIRKLSGGQKKRASIAAELISDPVIIFMDEPTSGLDPEADINLIKHLKRLSSKEGKTIVVITHTLQNIHIFDKIIFLASGGKLAFFGNLEEALKFFEVKNLVDAYEKLSNDTDFYVKKYKTNYLHEEI
jgi:ABC-type multidrug transport system ATPase subunit